MICLPVTRSSLHSWGHACLTRVHSDGILVVRTHLTLQSISRYLAVYLFIVPLMESDGVGHISLDKWFPIVQHLHSRKKFGLNNLLVPGQPADCNIDRGPLLQHFAKTTAGEKMTNLWKIFGVYVSNLQASLSCVFIFIWIISASGAWVSDLTCHNWKQWPATKWRRRQRRNWCGQSFIVSFWSIPSFCPRWE